MTHLPTLVDALGQALAGTAGVLQGVLRISGDIHGEPIEALLEPGLIAFPAEPR